jgi:hypothetical protein
MLAQRCAGYPQTRALTIIPLILWTFVVIGGAVGVLYLPDVGCLSRSCFPLESWR